MRHKVANQLISTGYALKHVLLLWVLLVASNVVWAQSGTITLHTQGKTLKETLKEIEKQCDYIFIYSSSTVDVNRVITINSEKSSIQEVMAQIAPAANLSYTIKNKQVILSPLSAQKSIQNNSAVSVKESALENKVIQGHVKDENGEPIIGASVWIKGTTTGVATDIDGNFTIKVSGNNLVLTASFIGYKAVEQKISATKHTYNFTLNPESQMIEEVVVTGYQTISKERATGSFAILSPKEMEGKLQTNIMDRVEGMVAGLSSNRGEIQIRGVSTLSGNKSPLYVVDGIPFEGEPGSNSSPLDVLNPSDIVNITVLKDATAASIYGARSANGVIVITTRNGAVGPTRISYNGSVNFQGLPDRDYANKMSSRELVDFQKMVFESYPNMKRKDIREFQNEVQLLLIDHQEGKLTSSELETKLDEYRNRDRYDQVVDEFLRKKRVTHQHNLSFNGGSDFYRYSLSANYTGTAPYEKEQMEHRVGFNLKNTFNFFKWFRFDAGILGSQLSADYDNGVSGMSMLNQGSASYHMLRDEAGNALQMYDRKSQYEIDRLNKLGLMDESYRPVDEMGTRHYTQKSKYLNLNFGAHFKIIDGLSLDLRYQTESTTGFRKQYDTKDAFKVKTMINDATRWNSTKKVYENIIPVGGQITQTNTDNYSYTLRAQLNYNKVFNENHDLQILAGAERRKVVTSSHGFYRVGYDDNSLAYSEIDALTLNQQVKGTESLYGTFNFTNNTPRFTHKDDRYVSFYGNASYTYNQRLTVTGSIRIDQSNLFGTDPKYQYKPLWSIGGHYSLFPNRFEWLDRFVVRATYGINGNIHKLNGPYLIAATSSRNNTYTNESSFYIQTPPNPTLRWEKTKVTNIGVDFSVLQSRLAGSVEFYNKNSSDLMGQFATDPTLGWTNLNMNFGSMYNRGVELTLNSTNIKTADFKWNSTFIFGYNKNKVTEVQSSDESAYSYYSRANIRKGYAMNSLFSIRYAGLDENGTPMAYKKDGTIVKSDDLLSKEDLVYSGTYDPPYHASFTNMFSYKGFDISFMFIYSGGHIMRDVAANMLITKHPIYLASNTDKDMMNYWKSPADNNNPNINPAFMFGSQVRNAEDIWRAADKHAQRGDFIKLRDLTLGYTIPNRLVKKYNIQNARVNVQLQNIWWWAANKSDLDPEVWSGNSMSPTRGTVYPTNVTVGLSLNF